MKLVNKRGNTNRAKYYTGTGPDQTAETLVVGSEPVELSEVHGRYMLNLFSKELEIVGNGHQEEPAPEAKAPEAKVEKAEQTGTDVNFKPNVEEKKPEEAPDLSALAAKLPKGLYICSKCKVAHQEKSGKGVTHARYRVEAPV